MRARFLAAALVAAMGTSGCIGSFALFERVQSWNRTVSDKWVNSVIHFALWIVPVYEVCLLGDLLVLNTMEFWTGDNPAGHASIEPQPDGSARVVVDGRAYELIPAGDDSLTVWRDEQYLGSATRRADGAWMLEDELYQRSVVISAEEAQRLLALMPART